MPNKIKLTSIYIGILLLSLATLMLEVSLTKVFSVAQWHHFAFMVISLALLGFGASGSFIAIFPSLLKRDSSKLLTLFSTIFAVTCIISFGIANLVPFDQYRLIVDRKQLLYLLVYYILLAIPFFLTGACLTIILTKEASRANQIYFFNLLGSGMGCLLVIPFLAQLGGSGIIIFAATLGAFAALLFSLGLSSKKAIPPLVVLVAILLFFSLSPPGFLEIRITPYKTLPTLMRFPGTEVLSTRWNSLARVDVVKSSTIRSAPGLSLKHQELPPPQLGITTDGDSLSAITNYGGDWDNLKFTAYLPTALPYRLRTEAEVLNIGCGGGLDILTALYNGAASVTGVEINPLVVDIVENKYRRFAQDIYSDPRVLIVVDEGRSFLRSSRERYDVIQIALLDSLAASSAGVYSLSENYLYTVQSFEDYYHHLSEQGLLSITRWLFLPPRDLVRLTSLALTALERIGVENPPNHLALIRTWGMGTFLLKRSEFTPEEIDKIKEFCKEMNFDLVYLPSIKSEEVNIYNNLPEPYYYRAISGLISTDDRRQFYRDYIIDIGPVTDDRPFFYHYFKWSNIFSLYKSMGRRWEPFILWGDLILAAVLGQALLAGIILILLPLLRRRDKSEGIAPKGLRHRILFYFLCLGLGYMFVEIALIQKFILFLGHPVYALSVILFSLLSFSGLGSFVSRKFGIDKIKRNLSILLILLGALILIYTFSLSVIFDLLLGQGLLIRIIMAIILLFPLGFVMGIPFPLGIRVTDSLYPSLIPWAWGVNSCASVVSSVLAVALALYFGFPTVLIIASAIYFMGWMTMRGIFKFGSEMEN